MRFRMFEIIEVYNGKNKFNIYNHNFDYKQLNNEIIDLLLNESALKYLFTANNEDSNLNYIEMLRRFIPEEFCYLEKKYLEDWVNSKQVIKKLMDSNNGFYSFYAEALMAYLNYKILGYSLTYGVIGIDETLSDQKTGADACMFCEGLVILGEAKFYKSFDSAKNKIISDFSSKSLINKIRSLYRKSHKKVVVYLKEIYGNRVNKLSLEQFIEYNILLSGFILHNKKDKYSYKEIDNIQIVNGLGKYNIVFYHLPINSKEELIYMIIKRVLEVIVNESR